MKKAILIPDSFKGTLSSSELCRIMAEGIKKHFPMAEVISVPVADGGEGSVDAFLCAVGGEKIPVTVRGPFGEAADAFYGKLPDGTAVVEMAAAAGLPLVAGRADPEAASTYGVGELLLRAVSDGAKKVILGLGGSATNDFGCGAAAALGVRFYDGGGNEFVPTGGTLSRVSRVDVSGVSPLIASASLSVMCDIDNPPYGERGAAAVFARQKGATEESVPRLEAGVKHLCGVCARCLGTDVSLLPGGGAAGAMGAGMAAFFGAELRSGIGTVLDTVGFDALLDGADMVFTGEGKVDTQSLGGKVIVGVARRARAHGVPVTVLCGGAEPDIGALYGEGISAVFPINRLPEDLSVSRYKSAENAALTFDNILRLMKAGGGKK